MATTTTGPITHFQADVQIPGHLFPLRGEITEKAILELAFNGTTPEFVAPSLREKADRLKAALLAGRLVETPTALISPLTADDYKARRLTPKTGYERIS